MYGKVQGLQIWNIETSAWIALDIIIFVRWVDIISWRFIHIPPQINLRFKWETPASSGFEPQTLVVVATPPTRLSVQHSTSWSTETCPKEHAQLLCICMSGTHLDTTAGQLRTFHLHIIIFVRWVKQVFPIWTWRKYILFKNCSTNKECDVQVLVQSVHHVHTWTKNKCGNFWPRH